MATATTRLRTEKKTTNSPTNETYAGDKECKPQHDETETPINALTAEIRALQNKLSDKEETIDYLVQERDEASREIYELKLKLADAWKITVADDAEKVREVARLVRISKEERLYSAAAKRTEHDMTSIEESCTKPSKTTILTNIRGAESDKREKSNDGNPELLAETRLHGNNDATKAMESVLNDSGICMDEDALKDHIERRIDSLIEIKLNKRLPDLVRRKSVESETWNMNAPTNDSNTDDDTWKAETEERERDSNIVIHGLDETNCNKIDQTKIINLFNIVENTV